MSIYNKIVKNINNKEKDLTAERNNRCVPIAIKILKMIGDFGNHKLGDNKQQEISEAYKPLVEDILRLLLEHNVLLSDIDYIVRLVAQPLDFTSNMLQQSLNNSINRISTYTWGKELAEVTLGDMDKLLKEQFYKNNSTLKDIPLNKDEQASSNNPNSGLKQPKG